MIVLDDRYIITTDSRNYKLQKKLYTDSETGEGKYTVIAYSDSLSRAIRRYIEITDRKTIQHGIYTLDETISLIEQNHKMIMDKINGAIPGIRIIEDDERKENIGESDVQKDVQEEE